MKTGRGERLTRSEQKDADVVYRACIVQFKVGVGLVDLLQVGLNHAASDDAPEHGTWPSTSSAGRWQRGVGGPKSRPTPTTVLL